MYMQECLSISGPEAELVVNIRHIASYRTVIFLQLALIGSVVLLRSVIINDTALNGLIEDVHLGRRKLASANTALKEQIKLGK